MGLKEDQISKMTLLQKWTTVLQFAEKQQDSTTLENKPSEVVKELEKGKNKLKTLIRVRTLLTTETVDWCSEFIKLKGHQRVFEIFLATSEKKCAFLLVFHLLVACISHPRGLRLRLTTRFGRFSLGTSGPILMNFSLVFIGPVIRRESSSLNLAAV